ncbi:hypothetical protein JG688_00001065 [Phytophthora aleatoria]|uniref:Uncharacterized protein n=1 Tax=Phytophthora aleatoria TaxID=2496075 RepID=A0A8J5IY37_9STRA|nr:hypothetical protein JG688_00001065 [Phytophthora aleatoria]
MAALDHARALNGLLALPRLERMLRVYRTWVNVEGMEGGMSLTRRELQCVLEFPELDHHVDFLFDTFRCVSSNRKQSVTPRVDLVTLLTTAAMLAQGALADKAGFVFQLVDLDTEDDIVEAELALMDAMVVAYEAFDFVELEDGDKMTFVMFLKNMKDALEERTERLKNAETFLYYNDMHFGSLDEYAEKVRVVVGPIVGKVEATRVNVLLEVDTLTTVKCFAFALPQEGAEMERNCSVPTQEYEEEELGQNENELAVDNAFERRDTAQFIQTGEVGIFMCDMRSTLPDDVVTCNNRLVTPLTQQERAVIGEKQWLQLEKALKKKAIMIFVLCMELPLILTDAKHVDAMREEATFPEIDPVQEEAAGRWKLYDRQEISQHWVSCRRQLEQLLNLLFRWKAKHRGRDVIVLSGGMRVGLETMLHDRETKLSVRNLTVGPLTARVESDFANLPLAGVACPTFLGGARDERFTFAHKVVSSKNYLLTHAVVTREQTKGSEERGEVGGETKSASIETEFIADELADAAHPMTLYRRFPTWWANYVPMGKIVFWDDTVMMRAQSDEDVTALAQYLQDGREFTAALEVLFEKHQFAEAARMEELRSKHRRRRRGPEELRLSFRAVFAELWKVLPETHRQRVAYFQDEFVFDFLLGYLASDLFEDSEAQDDDVERPPLEFAAFSTLCRDFIFNAGMLNLCLVMQQEDECRALALQRAKARGQAAEREAQRIQQEQQRAEEEAELARLQRENPEEYAKRKLAEQEVARQEKLAKAEAARERRKAEKLRDVEEELAIAKEQRKLDKLAESGDDPQEFNRRRELLAARVRKLEERKRHRQAEEARRREMKEKKKKEKAAH